MKLLIGAKHIGKGNRNLDIQVMHILLEIVLGNKFLRVGMIFF